MNQKQTEIMREYSAKHVPGRRRHSNVCLSKLEQRFKLLMAFYFAEQNSDIYMMRDIYEQLSIKIKDRHLLLIAANKHVDSDYPMNSTTQTIAKLTNYRKRFKVMSEYAARLVEC
jgi:hypothetical protein